MAGKLEDASLSDADDIARRHSHAYYLFEGYAWGYKQAYHGDKIPIDTLRRLMSLFALGNKECSNLTAYEIKTLITMSLVVATKPEERDEEEREF